MRKAAVLLGLVLALALVPTATQAGTMAVTRPDGTTSGNLLAGNHTNGWEFSPTTDILVDALGIFDTGGDGLARDHDVKLWDLAGAELASVAISAGAHPLTEGHAFVGIESVRLTAGEPYVVSTFVTGPGGETFLAGGSLVSVPAIEVNAGVRRWASGDVFPDLTSTALPVPLGPNFTFQTVRAAGTTSAIPEPFTGALMLAGLIGFGLARRPSRLSKRG